jgi:hypothetical protein
MNGAITNTRNARIMKGLSLLLLALVGVSLLMVHAGSYLPAVSFVPLYLVVSVIVTAAVALVLLPKRQFGVGFCASFYVLYAALLAAAVFFTGGRSSELYVLFFPLLFAAALHGSWRLGIIAQAAGLAGYALAVLPDLLEGIGSGEGSAQILYRFVALALAGVFALVVAGKGEAGGEEGYELDEDGSMLLERVRSELEARRGAPVGVILVDPGRIGDVDLLLERVRARIGEPVLLGEGSVFGVVLGGVDDRALESAARRALAVASSQGAEETRAGAAVYPRDARDASDLLVAAGRALEAAFEVESPSAIVLAGRDVAARGYGPGAGATRAASDR